MSITIISILFLVYEAGLAYSVNKRIQPDGSGICPTKAKTSAQNESCVCHDGWQTQEKSSQGCLLNGHRLSEVAWLIDVKALHGCEFAGEDLQWDNR